MSRTIKRGPPPRRPVARRKVPVKKVSLIDRALARVPVSEATLKRAATWSFLSLGGAAVLAAAAWAGVPGMVGDAIAQQTARAGLKVEQVEITGLKRMDRMTVYAVALEDKRRETPMARVDLEGIRERLLAYGWIADAHVSRRLPDTLLVDIVERQPAAVWQDEGRLTLIDKDGVLLEPVSADAIPDLPLVIGPGADRQEPAYQQLLAAAPALKPRVKAATWIGNRRWDLTFDSGEVLKLPEEGAAQALVTFAERDGQHPLLGRGWLAFDMRDPTKLVARKPGQSMAHATDAPASGAEPAAAGAVAAVAANDT